MPNLKAKIQFFYFHGLILVIAFHSPTSSVKSGDMVTLEVQQCKHHKQAHNQTDTT